MAPPTPLYPIENIYTGRILTSKAPYTVEKKGYGDANFLTSDNLEIFFGAFYHELVCISLELKGSDDFKSGTCVLIDNKN